MINYKLLEKEISWIEISEKYFGFEVGKIIKKNLPAYLITTKYGDVSVSVTFDNTDFLVVLKQKFKVEFLGNGIKTDIYYIPPSLSDFITAFSVAGIVSKKQQQFIVEGSGVGKLKSIISSILGLKNPLNGKLPLHAAAFEIDNIGVAIVGARGGGKTTTIYELFADNNKKGSVLTDDWLYISQINKNLVAISYDNTVSYDNYYINKYSFSVPEKPTFNIPKMSASPKELFKNCDSLASMKVNILIGLLPYDGESQMIVANPEEMSSHIIHTAYHYPYSNSELVDNHYQSWMSLLNCSSNFFISQKSLSVSKILDKINEHKNSIFS